MHPLAGERPLLEEETRDNGERTPSLTSTESRSNAVDDPGDLHIVAVEVSSQSTEVLVRSPGIVLTVLEELAGDATGRDRRRGPAVPDALARIPNHEHPLSALGGNGSLRAAAPDADRIVLAPAGQAIGPLD